MFETGPYYPEGPLERIVRGLRYVAILGRFDRVHEILEVVTRSFLNRECHKNDQSTEKCQKPTVPL